MKNLKQMILAIVFFLPAPAFAGGGMGGGATEITQLMNNTELVASVAEEAAQNSTLLQQYITQVAQLRTMDQNLLSMPISVIEGALGPATWAKVAPFVRAYQASTNFQNAAVTVRDDMTANMGAMRRLNMQPSEYYGKVGAAVRAREEYWVDQQRQSLHHMNILKTRGEEVEALDQRIPEIDGQVRGFQHLALQGGRMSILMNEQQGILLQMLGGQQQAQIDAARRANNAASMADDYTKMREREKAGLANALAYPQRPQR